MKIILPYYKMPSWNTLYAGKHWTVRQEMANYAHQSVSEALQGMKWTPYKTKVQITVIAYLKRTIDCSNVCMKMIEDGMKICGLIKDDTIEFVESVKLIVRKAKSDYTEIYIEKCT